MRKLLAWYKNRYYISKIDLATVAETNRINLMIACPFLFFLSLLGFVSNISLYCDSFFEHISSFCFYGFILLFSIVIFVIAKNLKNVSRENAYIYKTIPFYVSLWLGVFAPVYNLYVLGHIFNSVIIFELVGIVALVCFSFSPLPFLFSVITGLAFLSPEVYKNFGLVSMLVFIFSEIIIFTFSLYKRHVDKTFILLLRTQKKNLEVKTFGNFTLLYENKVVRFSRTKSKELFAYLIYKNGTSANTKELISVLYGDFADSARYGSSVRNLISDIKHTFNELEIQKIFITEYNNFRINPEIIKCDYYDFLAGDLQAAKKFNGEFMSQYSWAEDAVGFLEQKSFKKK